MIASYTSKEPPERLQDTQLRDEWSDALTGALLEINSVFILSSQSDAGKYEEAAVRSVDPKPRSTVL